MIPLIWLMLYILTRVWALGTPNADQIMLFPHFLRKKVERGRKKLRQHLAKKGFLSLHQDRGHRTFTINE